MTDRIEPALSAENVEQLRWARGEGLSAEAVAAFLSSHYADLAEDAPRLVAAFNFLRRDEDPGKITWAMVDDLRLAAEALTAYAGAAPKEVADWPAWEIRASLERHADALASILPPREGTSPRE